eukprot:TRINITY_DN23_c0_g1_i3.p1 TRINITY_DN23_c0_g1~~TRINITY_DN23_c0_g1_i3.p1  ORF type:complete len:112 (-),score=13.29 TRINITY_DN23_c0_g1_i3:545-880(-)
MVRIGLFLKTNANINEKLKKVVFNLNIVLSALVIISLLIWHIIEPQPFHNFIDNPWLWVFPIITFTGLFGLFKVKTFKKTWHGLLVFFFISRGRFSISSGINFSKSIAFYQ